MAKKYITRDTLKKNTLADIFIFIINKKQTTRREIEFETGFSWGTVSANVSFLLEKGYITEKKSEQNTGAGRTTYLLQPTDKHIVSIGLDINRSGYSCEVITLDSQVIHSFSSEFRAKTQADVMMHAESLCQTVLNWCKEQSLQVFSLGIAMQGSVNGKLGLSLCFPNIPDWQAFNIKEHFSKKFHLPVYLGHDPKCMLLGEMHQKSCDDSILIRVDEGIGMAVSLDGKILDDTERLELGHTLTVPNGRLCSCGKKGCLEAYASLSAVSSADADVFANEVTTAGGYLSSALYNMYVIFRPQKMILTGKATKLVPFTQSATSLLSGQNVQITIDPDISAAYGAAVEAMKSAIRNYII